MRTLTFVVLGPNGPELTQDKPAGVHIQRAWDAWWFVSDKPSNKSYPPHVLIKLIGQDFVPRDNGDFGIMGVIETGNDIHEQSAQRFCDQYRLALAKPRRSTRPECKAAGCPLSVSSQ